MGFLPAEIYTLPRFSTDHDGEKRRSGIGCDHYAFGVERASLSTWNEAAPGARAARLLFRNFADRQFLKQLEGFLVTLLRRRVLDAVGMEAGADFSPVGPLHEDGAFRCISDLAETVAQL